MEIACGLQVLGNQGGILVERSGVALFDRGGRPPVQLSAIGFELRLVGDRANQRVVEDIVRLASEADLIDEFGLDQLVNDRFDAECGQQVECQSASR